MFDKEREKMKKTFLVKDPQRLAELSVYDLATMCFVVSAEFVDQGLLKKYSLLILLCLEL
jgi:hypothetical protein